MAHYLVSAVLKYGLVEELRERLARGEFEPLRPFGPTLMHSLKNARIGEDGVAAWEGADYCRPPLAEERPPCSTSISATFASSGSSKARAGARSRTILACSPGLRRLRPNMRFFGALLLLLASTTAPLAAPNIIVIMTDDQEDTGSMAYMPKVHSLLAEQGVTFTSFVDLPLCAPSRTSFLTGQAAPLTRGGLLPDCE